MLKFPDGIYASGKGGIYTSDQSGIWTMPCGPVPKSEIWAGRWGWNETKRGGEWKSYEKELSHYTGCPPPPPQFKPEQYIFQDFALINSYLFHLAG